MIDENEQALEQQRVTKVIREVEEQIDETSKLATKAHQETRAVEKNYSDNASVNLYEVDDAMETNAQIEQQRQLVSRAYESETILNRQLDTLKTLKESPYFGRIDIKDPDAKDSESLYIGIASLMNEDKDDFLVYDWRAPVSGIYYNGTLGTVKYPSPAGEQTTELTKKRQFTIQDGKITNMFDTNETVGDEMLQAALGQQNDQYMQNIVATIQQEQNDIIRNTSSDLLLVQGVAGSGKTSAILQRIAYLLYHSRASLNADQIVLFSPNRLFSNYISEVLPSLGERNMRQVTLADFLTHRFEGLEVQTLFDRYEDEQMLDESVNNARDYLESSQVIQDVTEYTKDLNADRMKFTSVLFDGRIFFSAAHIQAIFAKLPANMAIADRILSTKNTLIKELKRRIKQEATSEWVTEEINQLNDHELFNLLGEKQADDFDSEDDMLVFVGRALAKRRLRIVYDAIYNNYFLDAYTQYSDFLANTHPTTIDQQHWMATRQDFTQQIEFHQIKLMHCAPLLMMRDLITGSGQNRALEYVFIDEMQDYSVAMLMYLKHVFVKAKFTILGDSEQALFNELELPQELMNRLSTALAAKKPTLISLNRSYRSTAEITNFAKSLLPDGDQITAFSRHGARPKIILRYTESETNSALTQETQRLTEQYDTIAILTKNAEQAHEVYQQLRRLQNVSLLGDTDRSLPKGILVMPIYLAKGLEFDAVIAYNISAENYRDSSTAGILYTIASRAMHELTLISYGAASPLIAEKQEPLLEIEHSL